MRNRSHGLVGDGGSGGQLLQRIAPGADADAMLSPPNVYLAYCWKSYNFV